MLWCIWNSLRLILPQNFRGFEKLQILHLSNTLLLLDGFKNLIFSSPWLKVLQICLLWDCNNFRFHSNFLWFLRIMHIANHLHLVTSLLNDASIILLQFGHHGIQEENNQLLKVSLIPYTAKLFFGKFIYVSNGTHFLFPSFLIGITNWKTCIQMQLRMGIVIY